MTIDIFKGMSDDPPQSMRFENDVSRLQMERTIDHLADLSRSNVESGQFFAEILSAVSQCGGVARCLLWRRSDEGWQLAGQLPNNNVLDKASIEERQSLLDAVSTEDRPRIVDRVSFNGQSIGRATGRTYSQVLIAIRHAGQTVGILESIQHSAGPPPSESIHFFTMICEIAADFLSQSELRQLRRQKIVWHKWDLFAQSLWQSLDLRLICATIVNDGRVLTGCDRISVIIRRSRRYRLVSVSGLELIESRATATQLLESIATSVARRGHVVWWDGSAKSDEKDLGHNLVDSLLRYQRDSKSTSVGIVPVDTLITDNGISESIAVLIFDQFSPVSDSGEWQSECISLSNRSRPALCAAIERDQIPWFRLWQRMRNFPRSLRFRPYLFAAAILALVSTALALIPYEFTITGSAELWPAVRREVFASSSGIVNQVLVSHGTEVRAGQPLIILRDPELESEQPRVTGEIAAIGERLKGTQAARLTSGTTGEATARLRQLAGDEEELKERLRTLEQQRSLIEERSEALTLRSPVDGKILTWDTEQHLSTRPVERGQSLLIVGDTSGPWIVEVRVPDKSVGHLLRARRQLDREVNVDFMLASDPSHVIRGHVQEISLSSELDENARSQVRIIVAFDASQIDQPRPGATVLPRIHCGTRPLGYVWLHDLIDAIRTRVLF